MAGDNELYIYLKMVASQAEATSNRYHQGERTRIKQTANEQDKADKDYIKAIKLKERAVRDFAKEIDSRMKQASRDQQRNEDEITRSYFRNQAEKTRRNKAEKAQQARDDKAYVNTVLKNLAAQVALEKEAEQAQRANTSALAGYIGGFASFGTVLAGLKSFGDYMDEIRRDTIDSAKELIHMREVVLELAAMKNNLGNSTPELAAQLRFQGKTLQTADAANAMRTQFEGVAQVTRGTNLADKDIDDLLVTAGKLQTMENSDPRAHARLAGSVALEAAPGTKGDVLKGTLNKYYEQQKQGSFVNYSQFATQRSGISHMVQTGVLTGPQATALITAAGISKPDEAETIVRQGMTSVSADFMRSRKMKMLPGMEHETSAEYFQKHLGMTEQSTGMERLEAASDDVLKDITAKQAAGEKFNPDDYMRKHGFANAEAIRFYEIIAGLKKQGQWEKLKKDMNADIDPTAIDKRLAERAGREPVFLDRQAANAEQSAAVVRGVGNAEADLIPTQRKAHANLKTLGLVSGDFTPWKKRGYYERFTSSMSGYDTRINLETQSILEQQANKAGINWHPEIRTDAKSGARTTQYAGDEALHKLQQQIQRAGGNPLETTGQSLENAAGHLEKVAAALEKVVLPPVPKAHPNVAQQNNGPMGRGGP